MLIDWMKWLSIHSSAEITLMLIGLLLLDGPRYTLSTSLVAIWDWGLDTYRWFMGTETKEFKQCPSVCAIIVGLNEGDRLRKTLESMVGSYPRLEVVVCDDGSNDDMSLVARNFANEHPKLPMQVITRPWRGGKSSALNLALSVTRAEIVVAVDGDSNLEPDTIWEIVQPFANPAIGIVSGMVRVRNWWTNICTWCQAYEYLQCIFVGRRVSSVLGILAISSGALSAYRRDILVRLGGWDVGPGEDLDLALRTRKLGYDIGFAQYATCQTEAPSKWTSLLKQRFRWEGDCVVRHYIRKHNGLANVTWKNFRVSNFIIFWNAVIFQLLCGLVILMGFCQLPLRQENAHSLYVLLTFYAISLLLELPTLGAILYYSRNRWLDALTALVVPVIPFYRFAMSIVRVYANLCEIFWRSSFQLKHVPRHVRDATWHW